MNYLWPVLATLILSACHPHSAPRRGAVDSAGPRPSRASDHLKNSSSESLICGDATCPAGLGVMMATTEAGPVTCAGFMANDRTFVTNRHCLPKALKTAGVTCRGQVVIQIVDGPRTVTVDCARVLDVSPGERGFKTDYVYLQTAAPVGARLIVDRRGVDDGQELTAWTVNREDGRRVLRAKPCRAALKTWLNPFATSAFAPVSLAVGCELGSAAGVPLLNHRNEVVGLGVDRAAADDRANLGVLLPALAPTLPTEVPPHVRFTNFACVNDPTTGAGPQPNCAAAARPGTPACLVDPVATNANLAYRMLEIERELPRVFRYRLTFDEGRRTVSVLPTCVITNTQDIGAWVQGTRLRMAYLIIPYQEIGVGLPGITRLDSKTGLDPVGLLKPTFGFSRGAVTRHDLVLAHHIVAHEWRGTITRPRDDGGTMSLPMSIEECRSEEYELGNQRHFQTRDGQDLGAEDWAKYLGHPNTRAFCAP